MGLSGFRAISGLVESSEISEIDWEEKDRQFEEQRLPGQSYDDFLKTFPKLVKLNKYQCDEDCESDYWAL